MIRGGTKQTKETRDRSQRAEASHVLWLPMNGKASQAVIQHNTQYYTVIQYNTMHAVMIQGHRQLYNTIQCTLHTVKQRDIQHNAICGHVHFIYAFMSVKLHFNAHSYTAQYNGKACHIRLSQLYNTPRLHNETFICLNGSRPLYLRNTVTLHLMER